MAYRKRLTLSEEAIDQAADIIKMLAEQPSVLYPLYDLLLYLVEAFEEQDGKGGIA